MSTQKISEKEIPGLLKIERPTEIPPKRGPRVAGQSRFNKVIEEALRGHPVKLTFEDGKTAKLAVLGLRFIVTKRKLELDIRRRKNEVYIIRRKETKHD